MKKLRVGDEVIVLAGKNRRQVGEIQRFVGKDRVIVGGIQIVKKHQRMMGEGQPHGILNREAPIHVSNVAIFNREADRADRVKIKIDEDQKKSRVYKSSNEKIESYQ
ncbi:MAG: 50S ribosomal protein L24 [Gammaproteobacteria bacterium]|nr:50S ribosomal protein L24 [Gammaproteobacteria bacterium]